LQAAAIASASASVAAIAAIAARPALWVHESTQQRSGLHCIAFVSLTSQGSSCVSPPAMLQVARRTIPLSSATAATRFAIQPSPQRPISQ
jgi:hypothetical protein